MQKPNLMNLITMNIYWLGLSFMWNTIHPITLPAVLLHMVPETQKNTYLGLLTFFGLLIAMFIQPISGAISDQWRARIGRRKPLAIWARWVISCFSRYWHGREVFWSCWLAMLVCNSLPQHRPWSDAGRDPGSGPREKTGAGKWPQKPFSDMGGLIVASLAAGSLLSPDDRYPVRIMVVVMVVLLACSLVAFFND